MEESGYIEAIQVTYNIYFIMTSSVTEESDPEILGTFYGPALIALI